MAQRSAKVGFGIAGVLMVALAAWAIRQGSHAEAYAQQPTGPRPPVGPVAGPVAPPRGPGAQKENLAPVAPAKPTGQSSTTMINVKELKVMAVINGEQITRADLGREALKRYGNEVLTSMLNRVLIQQACNTAGIKITEADVDAEMKRVAGKFGLPVDRWTALLQEERGVSIEQYRREIIWPTIALRALAAERIQVSQEELDKAFETEFGPRVHVRLITTDQEAIAKTAHAKAVADPQSFPELAKQYCADPNVASVGGAIPPIRKHMGDANLEKIAFSLKKGQISPIIKVANQYLVLRCESHEAERPVQEKDMPMIEVQLADRIRDTKMRAASSELFEKLQKESKVVNVYNDPKLREQNPGVAALINNKPVQLSVLIEECIARNGKTVLEGEINRKLLTQELAKKNLVVKQEDIDAEVDQAAILYGYTNKDGSANRDAWLEQVLQQDGATVELYILDAVWPSVALKKLAASKVKITNDDLQKGFEANYGPRVQALAIVVGSQRLAQQIWEMARQTPTDDFFGSLAAEHSVEPVSRSNNGKVPPVRKNGGQPIVEEEAFKLKKGELSSILAVGDKFVILRCQGRTVPEVTKLEEVRDQLEKDIYDKKLAIAMTSEFDRIHATAQIDNFMEGSSQSGKGSPQTSAAPGNPAARLGARPATSGK